MSYRLTLLVRKTIFHEGWHPTTSLQSKIILHSHHIDSPIINIDVMKGLGSDAQITKDETAFVKFLLANYGLGKYSVQSTKSGFKNFWNGYIENTRFIREKGSISPYLKSKTPRQWHSFEFSYE